VLEAVGGFDETIYFFGEDTVPAWAARRLGAGDRFAADAVVHHEVKTRGIRWYFRWALLHRNWPLLIRRFPEMRKVLWCRFFLWPRHAAILLAGAGIAIGVLWPPGFVLTVPFLARYTPWTLKKDEFLGRAAEVVFDVLVIGSIAVGAVRQRTPML
jgi:GT2 family glycosyltransferase